MPRAALLHYFSHKGEKAARSSVLSQARQIETVWAMVLREQLPSRADHCGLFRPWRHIPGLWLALQEGADLMIVFIPQYRTGGIHQHAAGFEQRP